MSALVFALFAQQSHEAHIPHKNLLFVALVAVVGFDEGGIDSLGAKFEGSEQVFELPEVEDILGDIFAAFLLCYIHNGAIFLQRYIKLRIEANASKREQRLLASYAEREHFRASEAWSITPPLS